MSDRESRDLIKAERRHVKALRNRLNELRRRIDSGAETASFAKEELVALMVALALFDLHFVTETASSVTTSAILREAAEALESHGQHALAKRASDRAELLEQQ